MERVIANKQTSIGSAVRIAGAVVRRIHHPQFPANCLGVYGHIRHKDDVFDNAAQSLFEVTGRYQQLGAFGADAAARLDQPKKKSKPAANTAGMNLQTETQEFARLEAVIENNWFSTLDRGRALTEIRDGKLYRAIHKTFESYCRQRWEIGRAQSYRAIGAVAVINDLSRNLCPNGDKLMLPTNEAQCRPLLPLSTDDRVKAWHAAVEKPANQPLTARLIKDGVTALNPGLAAPRKAKKNPDTKHVFGVALAVVDQIEQAVRDGQKSKHIPQLLGVLKQSLGEAPDESTENPVTV